MSSFSRCALNINTDCSTTVVTTHLHCLCTCCLYSLLQFHQNVDNILKEFLCFLSDLSSFFHSILLNRNVGVLIFTHSFIVLIETCRMIDSWMLSVLLLCAYFDIPQPHHSHFHFPLFLFFFLLYVIIFSTFIFLFSVILLSLLF